MDKTNTAFLKLNRCNSNTRNRKSIVQHNFLLYSILSVSDLVTDDKTSILSVSDLACDDKISILSVSDLVIDDKISILSLSDLVTDDKEKIKW